ncbi:putative F-box protein At1g53550 [Papaver somniferum]|uniref:putative F-box protein At1g53550 n=1 Tax=Papaver somniferum TaxID=3469 RepID=UPI000E700898|nr:putative F-box protein At1g53550 [Papaver somniferum]
MGNFDMVPLEIMLEILSRVPAESIFECKLVSKPWRDLVRHPSFSQLHFNHLNAPDYGKLGFILTGSEKELYYSEYDEREYIVLPEVTASGVNFLTGFGYCASTNEYKLFAIVWRNVLVYTRIGWRNVKKMDCDIISGKHKKVGEFSNGAINWVDQKGTTIAFNLADEELHALPPPPCLLRAANGTGGGVADDNEMLKLSNSDVVADMEAFDMGFWVELQVEMF